MLIAGLDLETTGLNPEKGDRITEIGLSFFNTQLNKQARFVQRVNPEKNVSAVAQKITGLTWQMLKSEPTWSEVGPKVDKLLRRVDKLIAHNGLSFDFPFLTTEQKRLKINNPLPSVLVDTMTTARWATADGKLPSLEELCWCLGIEYDESKAHGAIYDADLCLKCYLLQPEMFK